MCDTWPARLPPLTDALMRHSVERGRLPHLTAQLTRLTLLSTVLPPTLPSLSIFISVTCVWNFTRPTPKHRRLKPNTADVFRSYFLLDRLGHFSPFLSSKPPSILPNHSHHERFYPVPSTRASQTSFQAQKGSKVSPHRFDSPIVAFPSPSSYVSRSSR